MTIITEFWEPDPTFAYFAPFRSGMGDLSEHPPKEERYSEENQKKWWCHWFLKRASDWAAACAPYTVDFVDFSDNFAYYQSSVPALLQDEIPFGFRFYSLKESELGQDLADTAQVLQLSIGLPGIVNHHVQVEKRSLVPLTDTPGLTGLKSLYPSTSVRLWSYSGDLNGNRVSRHDEGSNGVGPQAPPVDGQSSQSKTHRLWVTYSTEPGNEFFCWNYPRTTQTLIEYVGRIYDPCPLLKESVSLGAGWCHFNGGMTTQYNTAYSWWTPLFNRPTADECESTDVHDIYVPTLATSFMNSCRSQPSSMREWPTWRQRASYGPWGANIYAYNIADLPMFHFGDNILYTFYGITTSPNTENNLNMGLDNPVGSGTLMRWNGRLYRAGQPGTFIKIE